MKRLTLIVVLLMLIAACGTPASSPNQTTSTPSITPVADSDIPALTKDTAGGPETDAFLEELRAAGVTVVLDKTVRQAFFSTLAQKAIVNDKVHLQIFEFYTDADAEREVSKISPDGTRAGRFMMQWKNPPHFFHRGKLVVFYTNADPDVYALLTELMGQQVAGSE